MACRFHAIDARLPPFLRLLDGVQVDEGLRNKSQDNSLFDSTQGCALETLPGKHELGLLRLEPQLLGLQTE